MHSLEFNCPLITIYCIEIQTGKKKKRYKIQVEDKI